MEIENTIKNNCEDVDCRMNYDNLHELINRYENGIDKIYNAEHNELFKWKAMHTWRKEWFKPSEAFRDFSERFSAAKRDFSLFIDNSRMHPSTGVLKLWEMEPDTVEHLFCNILFADNENSIKVVQSHMDTFLEEYELLRKKYYPSNWSYKQDRHSASVFLAMNDPDFNYVYKSSEALEMAKYTDFGFSIGMGGGFDLEHYYMLGNEIVEALKEHGTLLSKHFDRLKEGYYVDKSLHLLAFDLMYCCRTYGYYKGMTVPSTEKTIKKKAKATDNSKEEKERLAKIEALEQEIYDLNLSCDSVNDISLLGVEIISEKYGTGVIVEQLINRITIQFQTYKKHLCLITSTKTI